MRIGKEVLNSEVKLFENSAHVAAPKRWHSTDVEVLCTSKPTEEVEG